MLTDLHLMLWLGAATYMEISSNGTDITLAQAQSHHGLTVMSPSSYHLLDHEYGRTPQHQIIRRPTTAPPRSEVGLLLHIFVHVSFFV
jgi:hypothetical protein